MKPHPDSGFALIEALLTLLILTASWLVLADQLYQNHLGLLLLEQKVSFVLKQYTRHELQIGRCVNRAVTSSCR